MTFSKLGLVWAIGAAALAFATPAFADTTVGPLKFDAQSLRVEDLQGTLIIEVNRASTQLSVVIEGDKDKVESIKVRAEGSVLVIKQEGRRLRLRDILTLSFIRFVEDHPKVTVSVPPRTPIVVRNFSGEIRAANLDAPFAFDGGGAVRGRVGNVSEAEIDLSGSGELELGNVAGPLELDLSGSSDVGVASSGPATIDLSGSSDVRLGPVDGGLKIKSSGSANVEVESVNGEISIRTSGSGDIDIGGGQATSFSVRVSGSANISFAGNAHDPDIDVRGSADVRIGSMTGRLRSRGHANVVIGD
jgi:hypothetical protein